MTITFPIAQPSGGIVSQAFEVNRDDAISPSNRGRIASVASGFPLWQSVITLGNTNEDETGDWSSFVAVLRGAARRFLGFDVTRPFPRAYPKGFAGMVRAGGSTAFDGSATSWSLNATRDVVTLHGLPANFAIAKRDYLGFRWGDGRYALVRAVENVTGNGDGDITFTVEPPVPGGDAYTVVPDDATAYLNNPVCLMAIVPQQTNLGPQDQLHTLGGTITAIQDLQP